MVKVCGSAQIQCEFRAVSDVWPLEDIQCARREIGVLKGRTRTNLPAVYQHVVGGASVVIYPGRQGSLQICCKG
jgi:hypothetical protein